MLVAGEENDLNAPENKVGWNLNTLNMKKLIYGGLISAIISIVAFSCQKDNTLIEKEKTIQLNNTNDSVYSQKASEPSPRLVIIRCATHRNKYDCMDGWGLCDCEWFPDFINPDVGDPEHNPKMEELEMMIDADDYKMTITSASFIDNGFDTLIIDNKIEMPNNYSEKLGFESVTINAGKYIRSNNKSVIVDVELK